MEKHNTYHKSVLLNEVLDGLSIKPNGIYVDATFGGGGHCKAILERLGVEGRVVAFDQDIDAWANKPDDVRLTVVNENFRYLKRFLRAQGIIEVDGIIADLGVSSFQFDSAERGFSLRYDGPLDMRMDKRSKTTASDIVKTYTEQQLHKIFEQYGEVRNSKQLAKQIVERRGAVQLDNTEAFKAVLAPIMKGNPNRYLAQVFQALRIEVNDELGALEELLQQSAASLKYGGRFCVISFHSLEDRIVKHFIKNSGLEGRGEEKQFTLKAINAKPIEASEEELKGNPRARSAKLRIAERTKKN